MEWMVDVMGILAFLKVRSMLNCQTWTSRRVRFAATKTFKQSP